VVLHLAGAWQLAGLRQLSAQLASLGKMLKGDAAAVALDGHALDDIDTAAALLLLTTIEVSGTDMAALDLRGFSARHQRIVAAVHGRLADTRVVAPPKVLPALARFGKIAIDFGGLLLGHVEFLGRTLTELGRALLNPRILRLHELFAQLGQVGVNAIPVVVLVTFLIGVVMAYMLGLQAEKYGANIFVVDGVALGITQIGRAHV